MAETALSGPVSQHQRTVGKAPIFTVLCLDRQKCQMVAVSHLQDEKDSASGGVETCYHKGSKTPERSTLYEDLLLHPPALG